MARSYTQKRRKLFSWLFAAVLSLLVLVSRSAWEGISIVSDVLFAAGLVLIGVATVGRLWCSLYICGYKTNTLITVGPYSACRNPLYFFSLLGGVGIGLATENVTVAAIILVAFSLYYPFVIRAEERRLRAVHGGEFDAYVRQTPRFWPSFSRLREPEEYTVRPRVFRRGVLDAMVFVWIAGILEIAEALHEHGVIPTFFRLY
ncbi:MAG TPA: isoprenylcysteine carboxylmethyltransferase family protein [Sedimentisphaerales bacterium]|jgi:protein-S-isoprenylcysteine O-methyltransferase Ste14|nr:isoprenylcysteine carboxylmethyltransferase family protein [Sedimentisphaerales bacterium]HNU28299.1 isoprenylcysteine carboxylmethyltransferase family protein [Sedimentisphaerales bacterium]